LAARQAVNESSISVVDHPQGVASARAQVGDELIIGEGSVEG